MTIPHGKTGRLEDERLLTGRGRYAADLPFAGALHAVVLRSPEAHADIRRLDTASARAMPGVVAVFTGADLADLGPLPCAVELPGSDGKRFVEPARPALCRDRVRHVGDPVALIIARKLDQARDAAEAVEVEYESLPALADVRDALAADAPQIWPEAPGNLVLTWCKGNAADTDAAFARAAHVVRLASHNNRLVAGALENRSAIAVHDAARGQTTLFTPSQGVHMLRDLLCDRVFKLPREAILVVTNDVGGGFGPKFYLYPEQALVVWAARRLNATVAWYGERSEMFLSETHARDQRTEAALALDKEGHFIGLRVRAAANFGAYVSTFAPAIPTTGMAKAISGLYAIPAIDMEMKGVFTNTVPVDAYRGAGKPEALFVLERLVDMAANETGIDRFELRRRNFVPAAAMPYTTATGHVYDSGDFRALFDAALARADSDGFPARRRQSEAAGLRRGLGVSCYLHGTGGVADENSVVEVTPDGEILVLTGTQSTGQGHETVYAQLVAAMLQVDPVTLRVRQGDTAAIARGGGTGGSSSTIISATTIHRATDILIERGKVLAGHYLETDPRDVVLRDGRFEIAGTDRRIGLFELAARAASDDALPAHLQGPLRGNATFADQIASFPSGVIVAEVEVDPETGAVRLDRLQSTQDVGTVMNQMLVDGQMQGGIVQGVGQALVESCIYDRATAQLLTGTLMDYGLPRADDVPGVDCLTMPHPSPNNFLGIKGVGELGPNGAPPAVINAVVDALYGLGVTHLDMPATAGRIWQALQTARDP